MGDPLELRFRVSTRRIGENANVEFWRNGQTYQANARLVAPPEDPPRNVTVLSGGSPLDGVEVANLSPAVKEEYGFNVPGGGVVVLRVTGRGFARRLGLREGDVLEEINQQDISNVADAVRATRERFRRWRIIVMREGRRLALDVG